MITENYVSFEIAKLLKEKGFDGECNRVYQGPNLKYTTIPISPLMSLGEFGGFHPKQLYVNNNELGDIAYTAPTLQMAMKWLREVHNIVVEPFIREDTKYVWHIHRIETEFNKKYLVFCWGSKNIKYESYEQACEAAIKYCLENLI